jgi:hypothetical protein
MLRFKPSKGGLPVASIGDNDILRSELIEQYRRLGRDDDLIGGIPPRSNCFWISPPKRDKV